MRQVIRKVIDKKGEIDMVDVPTPNVGDDQVLISTHYSLISSGTETSTIGKNPVELVKQTLNDPWMRNAVKNLVMSGGINQTVTTIKNELLLYRGFGYSGSGIVLKKGKNISHVDVGDKVAFAAQGHAEQVSAYSNHVVKVPEEVDLKKSAFVTVGAIGLQGVRRAKIQIGDWVVVYGLGLVGQLTAQILLASGAKVIGIELDEKRIELAKKVGVKYIVNPKIEDPVKAVTRITYGKGSDSTIICASSKETTIANNAMKMTRKQGKVVFVGIVKMDLERMPFFLNELDLSFSRAYGPGSYDHAYERGRIEYPYHYIRWTEKRNLAEIIRLIEEDIIKIDPLIDQVVPFEDAQNAFDRIRSQKMDSVAMLFKYPAIEKIENTVHLKKSKKLKKHGKNRYEIGVIGVGNFMRNFQLPNLNKLGGIRIRALCSASGINASSLGKQYKVDYVTSDYHEILNDENIDAVYIATRHNLHSKIVVDSANAGKDIFVEKPVSMDKKELDSVEKAISDNNVKFMVGYNRRHSHVSTKAREYIPKHPVIIRYTVNIQHLPDTHWTLDSVEGGGRLLGESDHFFDLMNYFIQSKPINVAACSFPEVNDSNEGKFNFMVQIQYENGSIGHLTYTSLGGPKQPREKVEIFCGDKVVEIVDFKKLKINGRNITTKKGMGHKQELEYFLKNVLTKNQGLSLDESLSASRISISANEIIEGLTDENRG